MPEETFLEYCEKLDATEHFNTQVILEKEQQIAIISASAVADKALLTVVSNNDQHPETFFAHGIEEVKEAFTKIVEVAKSEGFHERNQA